MNNSEPAPAPATVWTISAQNVRRDLAGGGRIAVSLLFRTASACPEIAARAVAIGRTAIRHKLREGVDPKDPKIAQFLRLQAESAALSLEGRRVAATLTRLRASREETLLTAAPGFSGQVVSLDAQITDAQAETDQSAAAWTSIATATEAAKDEALRILTTLAASVAAKEHSELRRRRDELVGSLPSLIGAILSEVAAIDRAIPSGSPLPADVSALLDELAAAGPPEEASTTTETPPAPPQTAADDSQAVETAPAPVSEPRRCQRAKADGSQCKGRALPGLSVCVLHRPREEPPVAMAGASAMAHTHGDA